MFVHGFVIANNLWDGWDDIGQEVGKDIDIDGSTRRMLWKVVTMSQRGKGQQRPVVCREIRWIAEKGVLQYSKLQRMDVQTDISWIYYVSLRTAIFCIRSRLLLRKRAVIS